MAMMGASWTSTLSCANHWAVAASEADVPRHRVDQHAVQRHQSLVVFPRVERLEVVLPHDDAERQIGMNPRASNASCRPYLGRDKLNSTSMALRCGWSAKARRAPFEGDVPQESWSPLLVGAARGHHKPHLVKIRLIEHVVGDDQVPQMNGVERPKIQTNASRFGRGLCRIHGVQMLGQEVGVPRNHPPCPRLLAWRGRGRR